MRSKLLILFLLIGLWSNAQPYIAVPYSNTFSLTDIFNSVSSHTRYGFPRDLNSCIESSVDQFFLPDHIGNKNSLMSFKGYNPNRQAIQLSNLGVGYDRFSGYIDVYNFEWPGETLYLVWSTSPYPTINNSSAVIFEYYDEIPNGNFYTLAVDDPSNRILQNTTYYLRPCVKLTGAGYTYGNQVIVTTGNYTTPTAPLAVSISQVTDITFNSFNVNVDMINCGSSAITDKGIVYKKVGYTTEYMQNINTSVCGNYSINVNNTSSSPVEQGTNYTVRPYVRATNGTYYYGAWVNFTTTTYTGGTIPQIYTDRFVSNFAANSVTVKGYIPNYNQAVSNISEYGICFSIGVGSTPTIADFKVPSTNINTFTIQYSSFTSNLTALQEFQEYSARAYVITPGGVLYGSVIYYQEGVVKNYGTSTIKFRPSNLYKGRYIQGGYVVSTVQNVTNSKDNYETASIMAPSILVVGGVTRFTWNNAETNCENAVINGYSDWHLPDDYQAPQLRDLYNSHPSVFTGFPVDYQYWTGIYHSTGFHYAIYFPTGLLNQHQNQNLDYVIPMRRY